MDDEMMLPNNGELYDQELAEQKQEVQQEKTDILASLPIISKLMEWFDNDIIATDSVKEAIDYAEKHELEVDYVLTAFNIVRELLEKKRSYIKSLVDTHIKN